MMDKILTWFTYGKPLIRNSRSPIREMVKRAYHSKLYRYLLSWIQKMLICRQHLHGWWSKIEAENNIQVGLYLNPDHEIHNKINDI